MIGLLTNIIEAAVPFHKCAAPCVFHTWINSCGKLCVLVPPDTIAILVTHKGFVNSTLPIPARQLDNKLDQGLLDSVDDDDDDDDDDDEDHDDELINARRTVLNDLYTNHTELFDQLIVDSDIIRGGMFEYRHTTGQFDKPSADYCFVYDEDDENVLPSPSTLTASCPSDSTAVAVAVKAATKEAYNKVGGTVNKKGN